MPINYKLYPKNWKQIRARILKRSKGQCECMGECGLHRGDGLFSKIKKPRRCEESNHTRAKWARGNIVLTIAHLDHNIHHNTDDNLKALCQRCHLRYDIDEHIKSRK